MSFAFTLSQLATIVEGRPRDADERVITGAADLSEAGPTDVAWVLREAYAGKVSASRAGAVLVAEGFGPTPMPAILCRNIERSVARLLGAFCPPSALPEVGVHPTAVIHPSARIGANPSIGPHVVIDADVVVGRSCTFGAGVFLGRGSILGDECVLWPHVVVREGCILGDRVMIHPNAVIGADGFGYYFDEGRHHKIPHAGGVRLEDDVEIGACTCIDRAKFGYTVIGRGTKIDNLAQVAHNNRIGRHCILTGQFGAAGSVRVGDYCVSGGRAGILDNVTIGDRAVLAATALITKNVPPGVTVSGNPARDHRRMLREQAAARRLPEVVEQVKELVARVERLEAAADHRT
jgi:UDP-3-O-[3-hydroxymyristoyl] glucosamine N-acyltransferase